MVSSYFAAVYDNNDDNLIYDDCSSSGDNLTNTCNIIYTQKLESNGSVDRMEWHKYESCCNFMGVWGTQGISSSDEK